jgi:hypothetical protein
MPLHLAYFDDGHQTEWRVNFGCDQNVSTYEQQHHQIITSNLSSSSRKGVQDHCSTFAGCFWMCAHALHTLRTVQRNEALCINTAPASLAARHTLRLVCLQIGGSEAGVFSQ